LSRKLGTEGEPRQSHLLEEDEAEALIERKKDIKRHTDSHMRVLTNQEITLLE